MTQNIFITAIKSLFIDLIGEILYFPIWWYTQGLKRMTLYILNSIKGTLRSLALPLMFKNIFNPMFGQYDRQGRIISFFMRLILTFSRLLVFIVLTILHIIMFIFWIILPLAVAWGIANNFSVL